MGTEQEAPRAPVPDDFTAELTVGAPPALVFAAVATPDGLAAWWTPIVSGSLAPGTRFELGLPESDATIELRVERARRPALVEWTCIGHSGRPEWKGTIVEFQLTARGEHATDVVFRHAGLARGLGCYRTSAREWNRLLMGLRVAAEASSAAPTTDAPAAA